MYKKPSIKSLFIALALLLAFQTSHSRQVSGSVDTDRLEQLLKESTGEERLEILAQLIERLHRNDRKKTMVYCTNARNILNNNMPPDVVRRVWFWIGKSYLVKNELDSARACVDRLKTWAKESNYSEAKADASLLEGDLFIARDAYDEALIAHEKSFNTYDSLNSKTGIARSLNSLGRIYIRKGNYESALSHLTKALQISKQLPNDMLASKIMDNIGLVYELWGKYNKSLSYHERSLEIGEEIGDNLGICNSLQGIAVFHYHRNNFDQASAYYKRSLILLEKLEDKKGISHTLFNIGRVHTSLGDYEKALTYITRALEIGEEINDKISISNIMIELASILLKLGNYDESLDFSIRSLSIKEELGDKFGVGIALGSMAHVHKQMGNYDESLSLYVRSLALYEEIGTKSGIANSLMNVGGLYLEYGNYQEALSYNTRALEIYRQLGHYKFLVKVYTSLSQIQRLTNNLDSALAYNNLALVEADSLKFLPEIRDIYAERTLIFEQMGLYDSALYAHRSFKVVHDSLFSTDSQSVIAELQQQYKTKEQKQKIELLEKDKQFNQLAMFGLGFGLILISVLSFVVYNRYKIKSRANQIIQSKSDELEKSHVELKSLSEFKQGMTGMIVHDIKNPLNSIIGISERINEKGSDKIAQASRMILQLISNMLDVEKYENTSPKINLKRVMLSDLLSEAQLSVELLMVDKSVNLKIDLQQDYQLEVDSEMTVRVFINLLSNAIKFTPTHSEVVIKASHQNKVNESMLKLSFADQGKGIDQDDLPHVFDKFWQSEARHSGMASSTGLGLSFCKMAVMAHDGNIYVESESEKGSVFVIELPIKNPKKLIGKKGPEEVRSQSLNQKNHESLKPYARRLKALKVHQVSSIMDILDEIEALNLNSKWVNEMKSAVIYSNKREYESLLLMIM